MEAGKRSGVAAVIIGIEEGVLVSLSARAAGRTGEDSNSITF
jgi:hypothetical protein